MTPAARLYFLRGWMALAIQRPDRPYDEAVCDILCRDDAWIEESNPSEGQIEAIMDFLEFLRERSGGTQNCEFTRACEVLRRVKLSYKERQAGAQQMIPIETTGTDIEAAWNSFGISRCDFRPQWDGDLVNLFTVVDIQQDESTTEQFMKDCARAMARWVGEHKEQFGADDRFQIMIGWPKSIRTTRRQTIKTGGTYDDLIAIATGEIEIEMRRDWSLDVFTKGDQANKAQPPTD
ncbi:MAG: hypothetical protein MUF31_10985 [Akkermansiaceae bacterium]|nr:hypothetical protein [Akkermansiaceae bacterium]